MKRLTILALTVFYMFSYAISFGYSDIKNYSDFTGTGSEKVDIVNEYVEDIIESDLELALQLSQENLRYSVDAKYVKGEIDTLNAIGYIKIKTGDIRNSVNYFKMALEKSLSEDYTTGYGYALNGYGMAWIELGEYSEALSKFNNAEIIFKETDNLKGLARIKSNTGSVYEEMALYDKALLSYQEALNLFESLKMDKETSVALNNIGYLNFNMGNLDISYQYYVTALGLSDKNKLNLQSSNILNNIGQYYMYTENYDNAYETYHEAFNLIENMNIPYEKSILYMNIGDYFETTGDYEKAMDFYTKANELLNDNDLTEYSINVLSLLGSLSSKKEQYFEAIEYHLDALDISKDFQNYDGLLTSLKNLAFDYKNLGDLENSNYYLMLYTQTKDKVIEKNTTESFANYEILYQSEKKSDQLIEKSIELRVNEEKRTRLIIIASIVSALSLLCIILLFVVIKERSKSEKLLLNVLPKRIADKLKKYGKAEPETFDDVTIYFSDVVSFTTISENYEPDELISILNEIFTEYDNIMEKYGCIRVKTIGDAYLAVCGINGEADHAKRMIDASKEIVSYMYEYSKDLDHKWEIRVGINSGKIVGGIVGIKKYIYDIFGDTINMASRMESNSLPGRINISSFTYDHVKDFYEFEKRDLINIKGKGEHQMYFVK